MSKFYQINTLDTTCNEFGCRCTVFKQSVHSLLYIGMHSLNFLFQNHSIIMHGFIFISFPQDLIRAFNNPWVRHIPCGSYSGYGTARDLAKLMGILADDGSYNGTALMSRDTTAMLTEVLTEGDEYVMGRNTQFGRGVTPVKSPLVSYSLNHAIEQM